MTIGKRREYRFVWVSFKFVLEVILSL